MRLLLISKWVAGGTRGDFFYPGVWRDTFELALCLSKLGFEVGILTPKIYKTHSKRFNIEFGTELKKNKITHFISPVYIAFADDWGKFRLRLFQSELGSFFKFKPDVIQYMEFGMSILYPFIGKTPLVFYSCYLQSGYPGEKEDLAAKREDWSEKSTLLLSLFNKVQNLIYFLATQFFGSRTIAGIVKRGGILVLMNKKGYKTVKSQFKNNVFYISKGIDSTRNKKILRSHRKTRILYIGSILYAKGIFDLLKAFSQITQEISSVELIIVGAGPQTIVNKLKHYIKTKKLNVQYKKSKSYLQKWKLYFQSDIFCLPSYKDAYPSVIFEAQSAGLPVITTHEIDSTIIPGKTGLLFHAGDIKALKQALIRLIIDSKERSNMSKNTFAKSQIYSLQESAKKFSALYSKLKSYEEE